MDLSLVLRLEKKIDRLLDLNEGLVEECRRLRAETSTLMEDRERFRVELDRILAKLDRLGQEQP